MSSTEEQQGPHRRGGSRKRRRGPIPLYKRSSSHFRPAVRQVGTELLENGGVELAIEGTRAHARVAAAEEAPQAVGVDWSQVEDKRALHSFCECARFSAGRPCEHVWATLLALAEAGSQHQAPGKDRVSLRKDGASQWSDLGATGTAPVPRLQQTVRKKRPRVATAKGHHQGGGTSWRAQLDAWKAAAAKKANDPQRPPGGGEDAELRLLINATASRGNGGLVLDLFSQRATPGGKPGKLKRTGVAADELAELLLPEVPPGLPGGPLAVVTAADPGLQQHPGRGRRKQPKNDRIQRFRLPPRLYEPVLDYLSAAGALGWWDGRRPTSARNLSWDSGSAWQLALRIEVAARSTLRLRGSLERNGESVPLSRALLVLPAADGDRSLIVFPDAVAGLETSEGDMRWIAQLRKSDEVLIPVNDLDELLTELARIPDLPRLEIPAELRHAEQASSPRPRLVLTQDAGSVLPNAPLLAELSFLYGDMEVSAGDPRPVVEEPGPKLLRRDMESEHVALLRLLETAVQPVADGGGHELELRPQEVPAVAEPLLADGWIVEVNGASVRAPSPPQLRIESGIDWFELAGGLEFAGDEIELKEILEAVSKGDRFIHLRDGSRGLLPAAWSETYDSLARLAHDESEEGLRFLPSQAMLVDALLIEMPPAAVDKTFAELREKLRSFERIKPKKEPRGFQGTLRGYQRDGLGWLDFLRQYGLGGVLADDMGLGKTVQLLALLRACRTPKKTTGLPWLVVVPRSLLYNWTEEAARFTPKLKVVQYGGPGREALQPKLGNYDLVLTTYGTLRRDVGFLATVEFDTIVLDEAQAIKNRESQAAKASRLLVARHRLALTGTPIENHLGELGSIFEFLNPGLLGRLPTLEALLTGGSAGKEELEKIARGIRPFILRRTKAQVLPDLPPKTEQVLHCTLNDRQRELYDQLRAGYQASLLAQAESEGVSSSAIQVLEALLRLRQVACHPGLVNDEWASAGSAKLETLFELVDEVLDEGHKVVVFSQFTKLLGFVRTEVEERGIAYAYLDGQTRKRGEVVERFQTDPDCNLFLISLKAGGVGLNLTAAGYVFLLDPWWNPAVEAQAIDRTHRIGQTQPVFAYRLIAQDTVEDKILELQSAKRDIADAILEGEGMSLRDLSADDLKLLLS